MSDKILVLSDIHSNLEGLVAVLDDAQSYGPYSLKLSPGDLVGYGPDPNPVVHRMREEGFLVVLGNHDKRVRKIWPIVREALPNGLATLNTDQIIGNVVKQLQENTQYQTNPDALDSAVRNAAELTPENFEYLMTLNNAPYIDPQNRFMMVHGSFWGTIDGALGRGRVEDVYIIDKRDSEGRFWVGSEAGIQNEKWLSRLKETLFYLKHCDGTLNTNLGWDSEDHEGLVHQRYHFDGWDPPEKREIHQVPLGIVGHTHLPLLTYARLVTASLKGSYEPPWHTWEGPEKNEGDFVLDENPNEPISIALHGLPKCLQNVVQPSWFQPGFEGFNSFSELLQSITLPKAIVNPGSCGQPRHGSPETRYMVIEFGDEGKISFDFRSVPYDVAATQAKLRQKGYPEALATRLGHGRNTSF